MPHLQNLPIQNLQQLRNEHERLTEELNQTKKNIDDQLEALKNHFNPERMIESVAVNFLSNTKIRNLLLSETALVFISNFLMKRISFSGNKLLYWLIGKKKKTNTNQESSFNQQ